MNSETKLFIETHINLIENNSIDSTYLDCPLRILNDFNNAMHIAGIDYPPEIHTYVVVCCYIATCFKHVRLQDYDLECDTGKETYKFISDNFLYSVAQLNHDLSELLPKKAIKATVAAHGMFTSLTTLFIRVEVN